MINSNDIKIVNIEDNVENIDKIVENTSNTWQSKRSIADKISDSQMGKSAENCFREFVNVDNNEFYYLPYDDFRIDDFQNHAPFDGLYISKNTSSDLVKMFLNKICQIMISDKYGKLLKLAELRCEMSKNNIFVTEIKSTRLKDMNKKNGVIDYDKIKNHDFLSYPVFLRKTIDVNFKNEDYYDYVENNYGINKFELDRQEKNSLADIMVRIYIDEKNKKSYILGYITRGVFNKNKKIKKMIQYGKSEKAIYWSVPIYRGNPISNLLIPFDNSFQLDIKKMKHKFKLK